MKYNRSGSLFRQRTKGKCLTLSKDAHYPKTCFHYIHQNPMTAKLTSKMKDWEFSSFRDCISLRDGKVSNKTKSSDFLDVSLSDFYTDSCGVIDDDMIKNLGSILKQ